MPVIPNPRHEAFAQAIARGETAVDAYLEVFPSANRKSAKVTACTWRAREDVKVRVEEIRMETSEAAERVAHFTRDEALSFLTKILRTPISELTTNSDIAHKVTRHIVSSGRRGRPKKTEEDGELEIMAPEVIRETLEMPNKLDALKQLCVMCGWVADDNLGDTVPGLMPLLRSLRRPGIPQERRRLHR